MSRTDGLFGRFRGKLAEFENDGDLGELGDFTTTRRVISLNNLLSARVLYLDAERRRERVLQMPRIRGRNSEEGTEEAMSKTA